MTAIKVVKSQPGWGAKCADCGAWITKWDWSPADAKAIAEAAGHECKVKR